MEKAGVNIYKLREVKDSERSQLGKATFIDPQTGRRVERRVLAVNGIFNDTQAAAKYASQNYIADSGPDGKLNQRVYKNVYFLNNPPANSRLGELAVAVYQKMLEGGPFGLSNSTIQLRNLMKQYGQDDLPRRLAQPGHDGGA